METALLIILTLVVSISCTALWVRGVMAFFSLKGQRPQAHVVAAGDGWKLCAWRRTPRSRRFLEPVVLCHGLSNNHRFLEFQSPQCLAGALADAGFECFTVELRGAGAAFAGPRSNASVDDHIRHDVPALIDFALAQTGAKKVFWIGHSLGGLVALGAAEPGLQEKLKGLVTLGSPVFFRLRKYVPHLIKLGAWASPLGRFRTDWLAAAVAPFAGWFSVPIGNGMANQRNMPGAVQRRVLAGVIAPIWRGVLLQLHDWASNDQFRSVDRVTDYRQRVAALTVPHLIIGGTTDLLAPPRNCEDHFALVGSTDKELRILGKAHGQEDDYGHGDLVLGTRAATEVYPHLVAWLEKRATPVSEMASVAVAG